MKTRRIITMLLALLMLTTTCTSCAEKNGTEDTTAPTPTTSDTTETTTESETEPENPRLLISDDLPEADFEGRPFIILVDTEEESGYWYTDEYTSESVNDTIYTRNQTLNARFNTEIRTHIAGDSGTSINEIKAVVQTGDTDAFQIIASHVIELGGLIPQSLFLNWYDFEHVDFSKPWWPKSTTEDLTVNGVCFLAIGDANISAVANAYGVFFDKNAPIWASRENIYDVVRSGRWTIDYLMQLTAEAYNDVNGNGEEDDGDYYGYATDLQSNLNVFLWAFGGKIMNRNTDGTLTLSYYNDHLVEIFEKSIDLVHNTRGVWKNKEHRSNMNTFLQSQSLLAMGILESARTTLVDYPSDFGILPPPKFDENQAEYHSMADGAHSALVVAKNGNDPTFVGIMTEALCAEAYKRVIPAYYDVCLKQRYAASPDDAEMIELCVESRIFDFGYVYDHWEGVAFLMQRIVPTGQNTITSQYNGRTKYYQRYYERVMQKFVPTEE